MRRFTQANSFIPVLPVLLLFITACSDIPKTPEALGRKISEQIMEADPGASGVFFESANEEEGGFFSVVYSIARQDTPDDPWRAYREVHFLFRPSTDPEAPGGWYLTEIGGEYLEYRAINEGVHFDWKYTYFLTENGPREGIVGLEKVDKLNLD